MSQGTSNQFFSLSHVNFYPPSMRSFAVVITIIIIIMAEHGDDDGMTYLYAYHTRSRLPPAWWWGPAYALKASASIGQLYSLCRTSSALKEICIRRVLFRMIERPNRCTRVGTFFCPLLLHQPSGSGQISNQSQTWV